MFPRDWQEATLRSHGDLYKRHADGFAHVRIDAGMMDLASVNTAPFGVEPCFEVTDFSPLAKTRHARIS
jgi:hypothetical protein